MKFLMTLICTLVIALAVVTIDAVSPYPASAFSYGYATGYSACDEAASFGWHAGWANTACYLAIKNDLFGGGWEGNYVIGTETVIDDTNDNTTFADADGLSGSKFTVTRGDVATVTGRH